MNEKKNEKKITASFTTLPAWNCAKDVGKERKLAPRLCAGNKWQKPTFEDVSGRVMAQPYIRFT